MATKRILIVDDERAVRQVLRDFFRGEGFEVCEAASGGEALKMAREVEFHIILTDLKMPDETGIEVVKQIRSISNKTAVFIVTGYPSPETSVMALELDVDGYISKPVDLNRLKQLVVYGHIRRKLMMKSQ